MITLDKTTFKIDDVLEAHRRGLASSTEAVELARAEGERIGRQEGFELAKRRVEALLDDFAPGDHVRRAGARMALERLAVTVADIDPVAINASSCTHPKTKQRTCFHWCTRCGAAVRAVRPAKLGDIR